MLKVYGNAFHQKSACQYYRVRTPLRMLKSEGLAQTFIDDPFQDADMRTDYVYGSDIQLHYLTAGKAIHKQCQVIREMGPARNGLGDLRYPPVIVFDVDDDITAINPLNPKFCTLGTRNHLGELLMPDDDIAVEMSEVSLVDGRSDPFMLWQRNVDTIHGTWDPARNVVQHAAVRKMAATAHAITCTGPELAEKMRQWNPRVHIYPNSIIFDDYFFCDVRRRPDEVRVLWQGGYSHFPDFYPLQPGMKRAGELMPHIKWVMLGTTFPWIEKVLPFGRYEYHPWLAFEQFHIKLGTLAFDINLAPLVDNQFNRCKSGIKFYEAAVHKVPTLAGRAGPYAREIIDGDTGFLFTTNEEFVDKLEMLVKDPDLRVRMGQRAHDWVREHRDARKTAAPLAEFYTNLIQEVRGKRAA